MICQSVYAAVDYSAREFFVHCAALPVFFMKQQEKDFTRRPGAKEGCGGAHPWACFSLQIGNFSRQNDEVTLGSVSLKQNALLYMHNI